MKRPLFVALRLLVLPVRHWVPLRALPVGVKGVDKGWDCSWGLPIWALELLNLSTSTLHLLPGFLKTPVRHATHDLLCVSWEQHHLKSSLQHNCFSLLKLQEINCSKHRCFSFWQTHIFTWKSRKINIQSENSNLAWFILIKIMLNELLFPTFDNGTHVCGTVFTFLQEIKLVLHYCTLKESFYNLSEMKMWFRAGSLIRGKFTII